MFVARSLRHLPRPLLRSLSTATERPNIRRVTDPSPAALAPVVDTLATAFDDDIMRAMNGGDYPALRRARMNASVVHAVRDLECFVASAPGSTAPDCVMLVKPPGVPHETPNETGPHTEAIDELIKDRPDLVRATEQIKKIFHDMQVLAYGPDGDTGKYYISHVGTAPRAAGHGLGGEMLRWMAERGEKEGVEVTLLTMTEQHKAYYERFGFHSRADRPAELNGTPTHWWAMSNWPTPDSHR